LLETFAHFSLLSARDIAIFTQVDGFSAFLAVAQSFGGDTCAAGLLIRLSVTTCNIHPSALGRSILGAAVVAVVRHNDAKSISR
jgi:hypothetical protein